MVGDTNREHSDMGMEINCTDDATNNGSHHTEIYQSRSARRRLVRKIPSSTVRRVAPVLRVSCEKLVLVGIRL